MSYNNPKGRGKLLLQGRGTCYKCAYTSMGLWLLMCSAESLTTEGKALSLCSAAHSETTELVWADKLPARKQKFRHFQLSFCRTINFCALLVSLSPRQQGGLTYRSWTVISTSCQQAKMCGCRKEGNTSTTSVEAHLQRHGHENTPRVILLHQMWERYKSYFISCHLLSVA